MGRNPGNGNEKIEFITINGNIDIISVSSNEDQSLSSMNIVIITNEEKDDITIKLAQPYVVRVCMR